jgi:hypothetical protein
MIHTVAGYPHVRDGALDPPATLETGGLGVVAIGHAPLVDDGARSLALSHGRTESPTSSSSRAAKQVNDPGSIGLPRGLDCVAYILRSCLRNFEVHTAPALRSAIASVPCCVASFGERPAPWPPVHKRPICRSLQVPVHILA